MNLTELIQTRRSIRKYEKKEVSKEDVKKLLEAVRWSPSWANTQCWEIIVVSDNKIREKLKAVINPKNPATEAVVSSPLLFALCGKLGISGYYKDKVVVYGSDVSALRFCLFDIDTIDKDNLYSLPDEQELLGVCAFVNVVLEATDKKNVLDNSEEDRFKEAVAHFLLYNKEKDIYIDEIANKIDRDRLDYYLLKNRFKDIPETKNNTDARLYILKSAILNFYLDNTNMFYRLLSKLVSHSDLIGLV